MKILVLCAGLLTLTFQPTANAATILSENFNSLATGLGLTTVGPNFTATSGDVDLVSTTFFNLCNGNASGVCVDLNGNGPATFQSILLSPGTYYLSFDLVGSQRGNTVTETVTFGNYNQTFTLGSGDLVGPHVNYVPVVVTGAGSRLTFTSGSPGNQGLILDNVLITNTTPEPASLLLMGSALASVAFFMRRRKA